MKQIKPVIGITLECFHEPENMKTHGRLEIPWNYAEIISEFGGVPLLIPPSADPYEVAQIIDGWLIPGGKDISPLEYGEKKIHPKTELHHAERYQQESKLFQVIDPLMPILGICYGAQFLNVVQGGTLIQHLPEVTGNEEHKQGKIQTFMIHPDSKLSEILATKTPCGRCYHHQSIQSLGKNLHIAAHHADGTIEAIEGTSKRWLIGVQWHPERSQEHHENQKIFAEFIKQAAEFRLSRPH